MLHPFHKVLVGTGIGVAAIGVITVVSEFMASKRSGNSKKAGTAAFTMMVTFLVASGILTGASIMSIIQNGSRAYWTIGGAAGFFAAAICWAIAWKDFASHKGSNSQG